MLFTCFSSKDFYIDILTEGEEKSKVSFQEKVRCGIIPAPDQEPNYDGEVLWWSGPGLRLQSGKERLGIRGNYAAGQSERELPPRV